MRNKKTFSFDEEADAKIIIENGFENSTIDYSKMYLVAKYLRKEYGYGEIRLERELIKFCKEQSKNFNPITNAKAIRKWIKSAMVYGLRKIDSVSISQKEISTLRNIKIDKDRKLLFITLILSKALKRRNTKNTKTDIKISDNYYVRYNNLLDIIRLSQIKNTSEVQLSDIYSKYKQYFRFYNAERELIKLEYADSNPGGNVEIVYLNNILHYYNLYLGENKNSGYCSICGKEIIKNSNKQKNCKACALEIRREQKKLWIRKSREKAVKNVDT